MAGSDRSLFHSWLDGRHPQAGWRVFGPVALMSKNHRSEQVPETAAMAGKNSHGDAATGDVLREIERMEKVMANACIAGY